MEQKKNFNQKKKQNQNNRSFYLNKVSCRMAERFLQKKEVSVSLLLNLWQCLTILFQCIVTIEIFKLLLMTFKKVRYIWNKKWTGFNVSRSFCSALKMSKWWGGGVTFCTPAKLRWSSLSDNRIALLFKKVFGSFFAQQRRPSVFSVGFRFYHVRAASCLAKESWVKMFCLSWTFSGFKG